MKILKDERAVALNDVIALCLDAAELYEAAADFADAASLAQALRALAGRRRAAVEALAAEVRRLDELPSAPPQEERVLLETAATQLKASLADASDRQLRSDCAEKEAAIAAAVEAAQAQPLAASALSALQALARDTAQGLDG